MNDVNTENTALPESTAPENLPADENAAVENGQQKDAPKKRQLVLLCVLIALIIIAAGALVLILKGNSERKKSQILNSNKSEAAFSYYQPAL